MIKGDKVAIVCCSNAQPYSNKKIINNLNNKFTEIGLIPVLSNYIYSENSIFSGTAQQRAEVLMNFYKNKEIKAIFDISGGDIANEILPYLNFDIIAKSNKMFWGYSDLTTIINAIYSKTGNKSVLYQVRNLIYENSNIQIENFQKTIFEKQNDLYSFDYKFVRGNSLKGIIIGGNIRCLLKLAGTEYWPDMDNKILLLEALGGDVPQMVTYLNQLKQIGVFEKISGILLGTFTKMDKETCIPSISDLVKQYAGNDIPIVKTNEIGHSSNSKAIIIGEVINL